MVTTVELTVVVVPSTCKSPRIWTKPETASSSLGSNTRVALVLLKVLSWNWNPSTLTLLLTLVAEIVISSSAVMLILAVPAPEFSEIISRVLSVAEFTL